MRVKCKCCKMSKTKITSEKYLEAVRRYRTTTNNQIANKLGVDRSSIGRFLKANPNVVIEAQKVLDEVDKIIFNEKSITSYDVFCEIPIIAEWIEILETIKDVKALGIRARVFSIMRVCNAMGVHPTKLDFEVVAENVVKWKLDKAKGLPYPRGCAYNTIRIPLRSFLTIQYGIASELLTIKGIGAEHTAGFGDFARERITESERVDFIGLMRKIVEEVFKELKIDTTEYPIDDYVLEMYGICFFMYYTATRIDSTLQATLNDSSNVFTTGYYEIHITDKGKGNRLQWNKRLIGNAYVLMSKYIEERFGVSVEAQPKMLRNVDSFLFPLLQKNYQLECAVMKKLQQKAGAYRIKQINHLWRHTFAQDWLHAMDGNYEVGAELGGWKDIGTMKRCYGAVSEHIVKRGLRKAMGLPVEDEVHELRYAPEDKDSYIISMLESRGVA